MPHRPHTTQGPSSPRPGVSASYKCCRAGQYPSRVGAELGLSQGHAWCRARCSHALDRVRLPGGRMAGQGLQAERQAVARGGRACGGAGWQCRLPGPLPPQTTTRQKRFRIHTSVHHNTDKFPSFHCLMKLSRELTSGPVHPRVPDFPSTDAICPSRQPCPAWPDEAHSPAPQPVWAPRGRAQGATPERPQSVSATMRRCPTPVILIGKTVQWLEDRLQRERARLNSLSRTL